MSRLHTMKIINVAVFCTTRMAGGPHLFHTCKIQLKSWNDYSSWISTYKLAVPEMPV